MMSMGYIGPVTPYDYIQYANRTVEAARKEKKIQAVSMIPTVQSYADDELSGWESYVRGRWSNWPERKQRTTNANQAYKKQGDSKAKELAKAQITGKGLNINEAI